MESRTRTYSWHDPAQSAQAAQQLSGADFLAGWQNGNIMPPPIAATLGIDQIDLAGETLTSIRFWAARFTGRFPWAWRTRAWI